MAVLEYLNYGVAPEGRMEYGNYMPGGNIALNITKTTYGGNTTTEGGGNNGGGTEEPPVVGNYMFLQSTQGNFKGEEVALMPQTATTQLIAYVGTEAACAYIGNPTLTGETEGQVVDANVNYSISGLPASGMTVLVLDNGTTGTTLQITIDSSITATNGSLLIPCSMALNGEVGMNDDIECWKTLYDNGNLFQLTLEWKWDISSNASNAYTLDLSNEIAGVNCDSGGTIVPGAILPQCKATLYFGLDPAQGAVYSISINNAYHVPSGSCTINPTTGEISFTNAFQFSGTTLAIVVMAHMGGTLVGTKTFNIVKNLPGSNGEPATTRWLVLSANEVVYDPNEITTIPDTIRCECWKQEGGNTPVQDTATTIYWKYDDENAWSEYDGPVTDINVSSSYIEFALLTTGGTPYEHETLPILKNGVNGTGSSPYRLDLDNQNASINCNSGGTILPGAIRPECTATLYYGENPVTGVTYAISIPSKYRASGITINSSTGVLHFNTSAETPALSWSGTTVQITVSATVGSTLRGRAVMNVSKNLPGADGSSAVSYWLAPTANAIRVDKDNNAYPSTITCDAWKQVGEDAPTKLGVNELPYIYYGYNTDDPSTHYTGQTITIDKTKNYLCFQLYGSSTQYDIETIPILHDGQDGTGQQGRAGAAVRGPYDWYSGQTTTQRRYCNGVGPLESDKDFIDIMLKDGVYYRCTTSYYGSSLDSWNSVKNNWTASDAPYNFVATELLLAQNAKIFFLTGNELYLMDNNNQITGGAAAGSGITFWAGSSIPSEGNFRVDYDGNIFANSGIFRGYIQMPFTNIEQLDHTTGSNVTIPDVYYADTRAYLIAYPTLRDNERKLILPTPTSGLNGFTYEIIIHPVLSRSERPASLLMSANGGTDIYCYAFAELKVGDAIRLNSGKFTITCIPSNDYNHPYRWALISASGNIEVVYGNSSTYVSTLLAESKENYGMINKIVTYSGSTEPSVVNTDNTMYVKK